MQKPEIHPGPRDPSVLTLQQHHRSELIWKGVQDIEPLQCRNHLRSLVGLNVHPRVLEYVKQAGFYGVHRLAFVQISRFLVTALVERWRQETHTFHLSVGEATVTLQDVAVLLGLKVHGEPVIGNTCYNWDDIAEELLGVRPPPTHRNGSALSVPWLRERFKEFSEDADELTVKQYARAYILILMGSVLFSDKSGNEVQLLYLPLLSDLSQVQNYSWASATLACLYRNLCRASQAKAKNIAGPVILLQLWSWEHIHIGRPQIGTPRITIVDPDDKHPLGHQHQLHIDPLGCRWLRVDRVRVDGIGDLAYFRDALDDQRDDQMTWQPYTPEILSYLPDVCRSDQHEWRVIAPLIFMDIVEWHHPDRVMRQFGFKQCVPSACDTSTKLHKIDRRGKLQFDYKQLHKVYLDLWETRLSRVVEGEPLHGPMQYNDPYMVWYRQITRLFVSPIRQSSVRYQPRSLHFHMLTQGFATIHARCQEKLALTDIECPSAFREFIGDMSNFVAQTLDIVGQSYLIQDPATHFPSISGYPSDQHPPSLLPPKSTSPSKGDPSDQHALYPLPPQSPSPSNGDPSDQHALYPLPSRSPSPSNGDPSDQHALSPSPPRSPPPSNGDPSDQNAQSPSPSQSPPPSNGYPSDQHVLSHLPPLSPPPSCSPSSSSQPQPTIFLPLTTPPPHLTPTSSGYPSISQPTATPTFLPQTPAFQPQATASSLAPNHIHIHLVLPPYHSMPSLYSTPTAYVSNSHTPSAYHPSSQPTPTPAPITPMQTFNPATHMTTSFTIPPSAYHLTSTPPVFPPQPHAPPTLNACPTTSPSLSPHAPSPPHPTYTPVLQSTPLSAPSTQSSKDGCTSNQFIAPHSSPYLSEPCFTPSTDNTIEKNKTNSVRGSGKPPKAKKRCV